MRKNRIVRITTDPRGKIKAGYKSEKGLPIKLNHFFIVNPETGENLFPEIQKAYGDKPSELIICFPSDTLEDVFNDDYNLWTKTNTKRRTCDGEICTHIIDSQIEHITYEAGTQTDCVCIKHNLFNNDDKDLKKICCKCDLYLKAYIFNPKTGKILNPLPYLFSCHSINSADNIHGMLSRINKLSGIPFKLYIKEVKKNNKSFPIWNIVPIIVTDNLLDYKMDQITPGEPVPKMIYDESEEIEEIEEIEETEIEAQEKEENIMNEAGEAINTKTDQKQSPKMPQEAPESSQNNELDPFIHLIGYKKRIESSTTIKDSESVYEIMIKNLSNAGDKDYLINVLTDHIKFIKSTNQ